LEDQEEQKGTCKVRKLKKREGEIKKSSREPVK
jgi:hypothetical protein